jgi:hypothetical protein
MHLINKLFASIVTVSSLMAVSLQAPAVAQLGGGSTPGSAAGGVAPANTAGGPAGAVGMQGITPAATPIIPGFAGNTFFTQFGYAGFYPYYADEVPVEEPRPIMVQEPTTFNTVPQQSGQKVQYVREWNQSQSGYARVYPRPEIKEW